jgi:hypothetical protein
MALRLCLNWILNVPLPTTHTSLETIQMKFLTKESNKPLSYNAVITFIRRQNLTFPVLFEVGYWSTQYTCIEYIYSMSRCRIVSSPSQVRVRLTSSPSRVRVKSESDRRRVRVKSESNWPRVRVKSESDFRVKSESGTCGLESSPSPTSLGLESDSSPSPRTPVPNPDNPNSNLTLVWGHHTF